jgi:hypothetical protein
MGRAIEALAAGVLDQQHQRAAVAQAHVGAHPQLDAGPGLRRVASQQLTLASAADLAVDAVEHAAADQPEAAATEAQQGETGEQRRQQREAQTKGLNHLAFLNR